VTTAEVMAKAEFLDECDGTLDEAWEKYKKACPVAAQNRIKNMHAALRALAEMEPTIPVIEEGYSAWVRAYSGEVSSDAYISWCKAFILAIAAEGDA
jgi:hypothetical protein